MKTGKNMSKRIVKLLIAVSVCMLLTGCVNTGAHIVPSVTIPPESTQPPNLPQALRRSRCRWRKWRISAAHTIKTDC